jgi:hypothetical protein
LSQRARVYRADGSCTYHRCSKQAATGSFLLPVHVVDRLVLEARAHG